MNIDFNELKEAMRELLVNAAEMGATRALIAVGAISDMVRQVDAYNLYGKEIVRLWVGAGVLKKYSMGIRAVGYKRTDLEAAKLGLGNIRAKLFIHKYGK